MDIVKSEPEYILSNDYEGHSTVEDFTMSENYIKVKEEMQDEDFTMNESHAENYGKPTDTSFEKANPTLPFQNLSKQVFPQERLYKCQLCSYSFKRKKDLDIHILKCYTDKKYVCKLCSFVSSEQELFYSHVLSHSRKNDHFDNGNVKTEIPYTSHENNGQTFVFIKEEQEDPNTINSKVKSEENGHLEQNNTLSLDTCDNIATPCSSLCNSSEYLKSENANDYTNLSCIHFDASHPGSVISDASSSLSGADLKLLTEKLKRPSPPKDINPISSYNLFFKENVGKIRQQYPEIRAGYSVNKKMGAIWNSLSIAERFEYKKKASKINMERLKNPNCKMTAKHYKMARMEYTRKKMQKRNLFRVFPLMRPTK